MEDKKEKPTSTRIQWLITIYLTTMEFPLFTGLCQN